MLPLFTLAEVTVIHLPAERSSDSHGSPRDPSGRRTHVLASEQYVTAYVLGAGVALLVWSRLRRLKLCLNLAMFSLEAVLGSLTYHAIFLGAIR